jgi:membrane protein implicated in regulation of membrane protease activity
MKPLNPNQARGQSDVPADLISRQRFARRLLWICGAIGVLAAATILLLFGISTWTAVAVLLLLACPAVVAWVLVVERNKCPSTPRSET